MKIEGFIWDENNKDHVQKHGLTLDEIELFLMSDPLIYEVRRKEAAESRFLAFEEFRGRLHFVIFTIRAHESNFKIRVISARYAGKKELEAFYEGQKKYDD